ncbi:alanine racemase [Aureisphaera galaxeae]|uniref:alanine racemase n=1 Tax=Aureisphaera galaxeae TaxID=1538023 RepID=UPI002350022A|nr:alanine racemase [Aureisphaera galaxeae]MDC8005167.1 alanine racemase [Aureisphaera galaxeae]
MSKTQETVLEIHLDALAHNYNYLTSHLQSDTKVMGVVKAFGYGSDASEVAKELVNLGVDYFAVAYVKEGLALRDAGITQPILVLHPQPINFEILIDRCLEPALYSARIFRSFVAVAEEKKQKDYPVHIKFNTGLNRLGFWESDTSWIEERLNETTSIKVKSLFSHLAASEDMGEKEFTLGQIENFKKIAADMTERLGYAPMLHQSNTSAILNYPEAQFDMVRTGIGLYGYGNTEEYDAKLKPVARLKSIISQIHMIEPGETVGYNRAFTATHYAKTATIPIGHADGISRKLGNGVGSVLVHGQKAPIIGNVCMDMLMVDITGIECKEGDEVIVVGADQTASQLAESMGSISYELLTAISQRVKRVVCRKP